MVGKESHVTLNFEQMEKMISLEFQYKSKRYYALIRVKNHNEQRIYSITIMDGELERLLYGHHVLIEKNDGLHSITDIDNSEVAALKECITLALSQQINGTAHAARQGHDGVR